MSTHDGVPPQALPPDGTTPGCVAGCGGFLAVCLFIAAIGQTNGEGYAIAGAIAVVVALIAWPVHKRRGKAYAKALAELEARAEEERQRELELAASLPPPLPREFEAFNVAARREAERIEQSSAGAITELENSMVRSTVEEIGKLAREAANLQAQVNAEAERTGSGWNSPTEQALTSKRQELTDKTMRLKRLADAKQESAELALAARLDEDQRQFLVIQTRVDNLKSTLQMAYREVFAQLATHSAQAGLPDPSSNPPFVLPVKARATLLTMSANTLLVRCGNAAAELGAAGRVMDTSAVNHIRHLDAAINVALERLEVMTPTEAEARRTIVAMHISSATP